MNFLSMPAKIFLVLPLIFLAACQSIRTREDIRQEQQRGSTPAHPSNPEASTAPRIPVETYPTNSDGIGESSAVELPPPPAPEIPKMPRLGIILGAGGTKVYAHIGFLHELAKAKIPVHAIGGVEFAAPIAALYAHKEQVNEVEWQMFKLKEEEVIKKTLLGSSEKISQVTELKGFFGAAFSRLRVEDMSLPFGCPSLNLNKNQVYVMNKGGVESVLSYCMAYPPYFRSYQGSIAGVREISILSQYLRSKGANHIVFVNVLPPPSGSMKYTSDSNSTENVLWSEIAASYSRPFAGVDTVISLDSGSYGITDFERRREIMNSGADSAAKQIKDLARKWGF